MFMDFTDSFANLYSRYGTNNPFFSTIPVGFEPSIP
jgi:hypothetical protein